MRSTGEVMGIDRYFDTAFAKSQAAANAALPTSGKVFVSGRNRDKRAIILPVKRLVDLGFQIVSTGGTADVLRRNGISRDHRCGRSPKGGADGTGTVVDLITTGGST
jgi:carbamoyl-phosphate synthase large subunit